MVRYRAVEEFFEIPFDMVILFFFLKRMVGFGLQMRLIIENIRLCTMIERGARLCTEAGAGGLVQSALRSRRRLED